MAFLKIIIYGTAIHSNHKYKHGVDSWDEIMICKRGHLTLFGPNYIWYIST